MKTPLISHNLTLQDEGEISEAAYTVLTAKYDFVGPGVAAKEQAMLVLKDTYLLYRLTGEIPEIVTLKDVQLRESRLKEVMGDMQGAEVARQVYKAIDDALEAKLGRQK